MTKMGISNDDIMKYVRDGGENYINALYEKMKKEKRALNYPIPPSYLPSMLSSFNNTLKES